MHAAALEQPFVDGGYSKDGPGRALFWGDFILAGPTADPVGVGTTNPHDIVKAYEQIAVAGANGNANFISRGGTPGTTVSEHAIWAQVNSDPNKPDSLTLCAVDSSLGGGYSPSTTSGTCPSTITYPSWYTVTGAKQAANIENADACFGGRERPERLLRVHRPRHLQVPRHAERDHEPHPPWSGNNTAPGALGGVPLLVNSFHAYVVNPAKFPGTTFDTAGARPSSTGSSRPPGRTSSTATWPPTSRS